MSRDSKTAINARVQNRYDELMREGKHGHYETMFRIVHEEIARERESMIADGWRQCAQGQRTTQFCGMAEEARKAEREACARVCEPQDKWDDPLTAHTIAAAIRARNADKEQAL